MNKLVSKNPVLRFKLGKLIVKALSGSVLNYTYPRYVGPLGAVAVAYDIYNAVPKNTVIKHLNDFYYGYDRDAYLKRLNKLKVKRNIPGVITKNGKRFWYGSNGSMTDLELYNKRNNPNSESKQSIKTVTVTPRVSKPSVAPTYYAIRAYRNRALPEGLNSRAAVMEYLKKLNKLGANIKVDGIWGDKTQAAYLLYGRFNPGHDDDKVQAQILGSNPTTTVVDTASIDPSIVTTVPTNNWIAKVNSLNNLHYNIDPIFKAKQGAKLVSRNPVERFKTKLGYLNFKLSRTTTALKNGGNIPKLLTGWTPLLWNKPDDTFTQTVISRVENLANEAENRAKHVKKVTRNTKIPEDIVGLLNLLWNNGAFKGIIDERTGKLITYEKAVNGKMGNITLLAIENNRKRAIPLSPRISTSNLASIIPFNDNLISMKYEEIDPKDKREFGKWLYNQGVTNGQLDNMYTTANAYYRSLTGSQGGLLQNLFELGTSGPLGVIVNESARNIFNKRTKPLELSEGTIKQMMGLHLYDLSDIESKGNGVKLHHLGNLPNSKDYKWRTITNNGKATTDTSENVIDKLKKSGNYTIGLYLAIDYPDHTLLDDKYNFNTSGTDFSFKKALDNSASWYDYARLLGGLGRNEDIPVESRVPNDKLLEWYNEFKKQQK